MTVQEKGHDFIQIVVDGVPTQSVPLQPGVQTLEVRSPGPGTHTFEFVKRTEPIVGTIQFLEFEPENGKLEKATEHRRRIEVIGDSITCGFGNEGSSPTDPFTPATENAYMSYASIAARAVEADVDLIAWSGRKMYPDDTIPSIYDLTVPTDLTSLYGFKGPEPEVVVINLGTNDFARSNPDESEWVGAYEDFIARVRNRYPKTMIYVAVGSMMSDSYPPGHHALSTIRDYLTNMVAKLRSEGDSRVRYLEFDGQSDEDGYGAAYHPNITTDRKMAATLVAALKRDLHW